MRLKKIQHLKNENILILTIIILLASCGKEANSDKSIETDSSAYKFEAIVFYEKNVISCNPEVSTLKLIKGLDQLETVTRNFNNKNDSICVVNLPKELNKNGLKIKLNLRIPTDKEMPGCYNFEMPVFLNRQL